MSVEQLAQFVKSAIHLKQPDAQVADQLKHVKLSNKLNDGMIDELQGWGGGAKTFAGLKKLRESPPSFPPPPPPPPQTAAPKQPDPPDSVEQAKVLEAAREYALNYERQLPNFICEEITRRYEDPRHTGVRALQDPEWRLVDTITTKLTYFEHHEKYEVQMVNNSSVINTSLVKLAGAGTTAEVRRTMHCIL